MNIAICDINGVVQYFRSVPPKTAGDVLDGYGGGVLEQDGVLYVGPDILLPGEYKWLPDGETNFIHDQLIALQKTLEQTRVELQEIKLDILKRAEHATATNATAVDSDTDDLKIRPEDEKPCDIMIGLSVRSMGDVGKSLKKHLEMNHYSVFLCTDMQPGDAFRRKIALNAMYCKAFIPLMDQAWAHSEECLYEFNMALRKKLTTKSPQIFPILCGDWPDVLGTVEVEGFLATANAIKLQEGNKEITWNEVVKTLSDHRINHKPVRITKDVISAVDLAQAKKMALELKQQFDNAMTPQQSRAILSRKGINASTPTAEERFALSAPAGKQFFSEKAKYYSQHPVRSVRRRSVQEAQLMQQAPLIQQFHQQQQAAAVVAPPPPPPPQHHTQLQHHLQSQHHHNVQSQHEITQQNMPSIRINEGNNSQSKIVRPWDQLNEDVMPRSVNITAAILNYVAE